MKCKLNEMKCVYFQMFSVQLYICSKPFVINNKNIINMDKASTIFFDFEVSSVILLRRVCESCDHLPDPRATNISRSKTDDYRPANEYPSPLYRQTE